MDQNIGMEIRDKIIAKGLATEQDIQGCSEADIKALMIAQGVQNLPDIYIQFLLSVGKQAGKLWETSAFTLDVLPNLKKRAKRLLEIDKNPISLPEDAFIFYMQEGMIFYYFLTLGKHNNPSVFGYSQTEYEHKIVDEALSSFLLNIY